MTAWVLIVAIVTWDGVSITHVPFGTQAACEAAAAHWKGQFGGMRRNSDGRATCHSTGYK